MAEIDIEKKEALRVNLHLWKWPWSPKNLDSINIIYIILSDIGPYICFQFLLLFISPLHLNDNSMLPSQLFYLEFPFQTLNLVLGIILLD